LDYCKEIGEAEGISEKDLFLLKIAAVFHDTGFLESPDQHEKRSVDFANDFLEDTQLSLEHIQEVSNMILATKIPQSPKTKLAEILCDADLAYMGTDDYDALASLLKEEIELLGQPLAEEKWLQIQIVFLEKHHYFTKYAIEHFSAKKKEHLARLKNKLETIQS
jgi:uncharacterized protein